MRPDLLVRDARRAAGLTQAELAARLGVSQPAVAKLERERANPTVQTLDRVLRATGHRLQLIAPAWREGVDESLVANANDLNTTAGSAPWPARSPTGRGVFGARRTP